MLKDLLQQYVDRFGENFPVFMHMGQPNDELIRLIKQCLEKGKPYVPDDFDPEIDY